MNPIIKIKICGLRRKEDIAIVNETEPDYIGFVFASSKREVSEETAAELARLLKPQIQKVGVFVDAPPERIIRLLQEGVIDLAQLHGSESEADVRRIREATGKEVIRTRILKLVAAADCVGEQDVARSFNTDAQNVWQSLDTEADYLLLDSGKGSGKVLNWHDLAKRADVGKPYFLAGGLNPENVTEALAQLRENLPYAVDVSSGVETDGYKDAEKIRLFIEKVRRWRCDAGE